MSAVPDGEEAKAKEEPATSPKENGGTGSPSAAAAADGAAAAAPAAESGGAAAAGSPSDADAGGAKGSNAAAKGANLSADAPAFVPGGLASVRPGGDESDILSRLPQGHRQMLRGYFQAQNGECVAYYVGRLKSFNNKTGYGFLECAQSKTDWGSDVFIHKNFVPNPWHISQPVEFAVQLNNRGQPQAYDVNWLPRLPEAGQVAVQPPGRRRTPQGASAAATGAPAADGGSGGGGKDGGNAGPPPPGLESLAPAPAAADAAGAADASNASAATPAPTPPPAVERPPRPQEPRRLGTLKSYVPAQGYGFIACEELFTVHQRDVYFDKSQLPQTGWRYGMCVEFTCYFNSRGQPQARSIDWDPIPQVPDRGAAVGAPAPSPVNKNYTSATLEKLRKLLRLIHEQSRETAVVSAIDAQGGTGATAQEDIDRDVDYVCFVLDRLGPEKDAAHLIKDFVKMLLMLMIAKMLRTKLKSERCEQLVRWFEALSGTIKPQGEGVSDHFKGVVEQISAHLSSASRENDVVKAEAISGRLSTAQQELQAKVATMKPAAA